MLHPIKKGAVTHVCCLITGDRFYFIKDPTKTIYEVRYHTQIKWNGRDVKLSMCRNDDGDKKRFNGNRVVVFMRSVNPRRQPGFTIKKDDSLLRYFIY